MAKPDTGRMPANPTMRARQLGLELRRLRATHKLSADEVATALGWSQSKVTRIEGGNSAVTRPDLLKLLSLYEVDDDARRAQFLRLSKAAREHGWWIDYTSVMNKTLPSYIAFESEAVELHLWTLSLVPGMLQTPEYSRAVLKSDLEIRPEEVTDRLVEARLTRQERLSDGGLTVWAVLDESVLTRIIGDTAIMRGQLERLLDVGDRVTLQVLRTTGWHPGHNGGFTVMHFDDEHPALAFQEGAAGDIYVDQPRDVARYRRAFDHLRAIALSPVDSTATIEDALSKLM